MKLIFSKRGEGCMDAAIVVIVSIMVIALSVRLFPVFITKTQLDTFASEVCREAEISGRIGTEVTTKIATLKSQTGLTPSVTWTATYISGTNKVQLNGSIAVTVTQTVNIGFGNFGSFPITLTAKSSGRSETYWK